MKQGGLFLVLSITVAVMKMVAVYLARAAELDALARRCDEAPLKKRFMDIADSSFVTGIIQVRDGAVRLIGVSNIFGLKLFDTSGVNSTSNGTAAFSAATSRQNGE